MQRKFMLSSYGLLDRAILENMEKGQLFVSMPRYKINERDVNGNIYKDVCNPITKEFREEMYVIFWKYMKICKNRTKKSVVDFRC